VEALSLVFGLGLCAVAGIVFFVPRMSHASDQVVVAARARPESTAEILAENMPIREALRHVGRDYSFEAWMDSRVDRLFRKRGATDAYWLYSVAVGRMSINPDESSPQRIIRKLRQRTPLRLHLERGTLGEPVALLTTKQCCIGYLGSHAATKCINGLREGSNYRVFVADVFPVRRGTPILFLVAVLRWTPAGKEST
jgi:hypothetical protein